MKLDQYLEQIKEDAKTMTSTQIGEKYGVARSTVNAFMKRNNIKTKRQYETDIIINYANKGYTTSEIAEKMNNASYNIRNILKKHNIKAKSRKQRYAEQIEKLAAQGKTRKQIAQRLGKSYDTIKCKVQYEKLDVTTERQKTKQRNKRKIMLNYDPRDMAVNIAHRSGVHYSTLNRHLHEDGSTHTQRRHALIVDEYSSGKTQKQVNEQLRASTWWHTRGTDCKYHSFVNRMTRQHPELAQVQQPVDRRTYNGSLSKLKKLVDRYNRNAEHIGKEPLELVIYDSWHEQANEDYLLVAEDGKPYYTWAQIATKGGFSKGFIQTHVNPKNRANRITSESKRRMAELVNGGDKIKDVADYFNCSTSTVRKYARG